MRCRTTRCQNDPQVCGALRQENIALIHSAPTGESASANLSPKFVMPGLVRGHPRLDCSKSRKAWIAGSSPVMTKKSMLALGFFHRIELFGRGGALKLRFPGLVGHAIDGLAAFVLAQG